MWEVQHNNEDWDCFKTLILPEIQKTQNQYQWDSCVHSEVIRSCQEVGCARERHQFHTVQQTLTLFLLRNFYAWMEYHLSVFGIWFLKCFILLQTLQRKPKINQARRESRNNTSNKHTQNQTNVPIHHDNLELSNVDNVSSNAESSQFGVMLYIFGDNEAVIKVTIIQ